MQIHYLRLPGYRFTTAAIPTQQPRIQTKLIDTIVTLPLTPPPSLSQQINIAFTAIISSHALFVAVAQHNEDTDPYKAPPPRSVSHSVSGADELF